MRVLILTLVLLALPARALAETVEPGSVELDFSGSFQKSSLKWDGVGAGHPSQLTLGVGAGYFLSPMVEIGAGVSMDKAGGSDDLNYTVLALAGTFTVNFPSEGSTLPFAQGLLQTVSYDGAGFGGMGSFQYGAAVGVRFFAARQVSFNARVGMLKQDDLGGHAGLEASSFFTDLGISIFLGRKQPAGQGQ